MRFFTPERYLRLGNLDEKQAFLAAQEDWEQAVKQYQLHLGKIRPALPAGLRRLLRSVYLHDARVLDMWQEDTRKLTITLHPESDPARLVVLSYSLAQSLKVRHGVLPAESCSEPISWLYDELDLFRSRKGNGRARKVGKSLLFHNILLSNGWEFRVPFHAIKVSRPNAILPATLNEFQAQ